MCLPSSSSSAALPPSSPSSIDRHQFILFNCAKLHHRRCRYAQERCSSMRKKSSTESSIKKPSSHHRACAVCALCCGAFALLLLIFSASVRMFFFSFLQFLLHFNSFEALKLLSLNLTVLLSVISSVSILARTLQLLHFCHQMLRHRYCAYRHRLSHPTHSSHQPDDASHSRAAFDCCCHCLSSSLSLRDSELDFLSLILTRHGWWFYDHSKWNRCCQANVHSASLSYPMLTCCWFWSCSSCD